MINYVKDEYEKIISISYKTEDGKIVKLSEKDETNYINSSGIYHFNSLTEGNSEGDFGKYLEFKEVDIIKGDTLDDFINIVPNVKFKDNWCNGEFYFSEIESSGVDDILNKHFTFHSYDINNNEIIAGTSSIAIQSNNKSVTLYLDTSDNFNLPINSNNLFKGFIRFNSSLVTSEKYKTFISKDGSVFSQDIIELYKVTEGNNEENN